MNFLWRIHSTGLADDFKPRDEDLLRTRLQPSLLLSYHHHCPRTERLGEYSLSTDESRCDARCPIRGRMADWVEYTSTIKERNFLFLSCSYFSGRLRPFDIAMLWYVLNQLRDWAQLKWNRYTADAQAFYGTGAWYSSMVVTHQWPGCTLCSEFARFESRSPVLTSYSVSHI